MRSSPSSGSLLSGAICLRLPLSSSLCPSHGLSNKLIKPFVKISKMLPSGTECLSGDMPAVPSILSLCAVMLTIKPGMFLEAIAGSHFKVQTVLFESFVQIYYLPYYIFWML